MGLVAKFWSTRPSELLGVTDTWRAYVIDLELAQRVGEVERKQAEESQSGGSKYSSRSVREHKEKRGDRHAKRLDAIAKKGTPINKGPPLPQPKYTSKSAKMNRLKRVGLS